MARFLTGPETTFRWLMPHRLLTGRYGADCRARERNPFLDGAAAPTGYSAAYQPEDGETWTWERSPWRKRRHAVLYGSGPG
jgi:hypothetical protein